MNKEQRRKIGEEKDEEEEKEKRETGKRKWS